MPNRWVREGAIESEPVNSLSWQAEVFWRRLINRVDDFGRYPANPKILRSQLFPLQIDKVAELDVERLLSECERAGLLYGYKDPDGKPYLVLNKCEKGRAKFSKHPPPPADVCKRMKTYVYNGEHKNANAPIPSTGTDFRVPNPTTDAREPSAGVGGNGSEGKPKEPEKPHTNGLSPLGNRISTWFGRRESTQWSERELKALRLVDGFKSPEEDIALLEHRYMSKAPYIRQDILTLLNNWNGEIDRGRTALSKPRDLGTPGWKRLEEIEERIKSITVEFNANRDEGARQSIREEITTLRAERKALGGA